MVNLMVVSDGYVANKNKCYYKYKCACQDPIAHYEEVGVSLDAGYAPEKEKLQQIILDLLRSDNYIGDLQLPVVGSSMMPMLMDGDIPGVIPLDFSQIALGDIIVRWDSDLIARRVIYALKNQIYTKGGA